MPTTTRRVTVHTNPDVNAELRNQTIKHLDSYKDSNDHVISTKIKQLNFEWDTERILEANAASLIVISSFLGLRSSKYWFLLTGGVGVFLLQHALQGWCPPVPAIRKMGVRTAEEINNEKTVLKMLRGDFAQNNYDVAGMLTAAEKQ